jgi:hypothetical protein
VIVRSEKPSERDMDEQDRDVYAYGLTYLDKRRLKETLTMVDRIAPLREFRYEARYLDRAMEARLVGIEPDYMTANDLEMMTGRFLDSNDLNSQANVCVIGSEVAEKLFVYESPIGKTVQVANRQMFRVIGITKEKLASGGAGSSLSAQNYNRDIYIPLSTDRNRMGELLMDSQQGTETFVRLELSQLTLQVSSADLVKSTASAVDSLLFEHSFEKRLCHHDSSGPAGTSQRIATHFQFHSWQHRRHQLAWNWTVNGPKGIRTLTDLDGQPVNRRLAPLAGPLVWLKQSHRCVFSLSWRFGSQAAWNVEPDRFQKSPSPIEW